jgi:hypothetical protein
MLVSVVRSEYPKLSLLLLYLTDSIIQMLRTAVRQLAVRSAPRTLSRVLPAVAVATSSSSSCRVASVVALSRYALPISPLVYVLSYMATMVWYEVIEVVSQ